MDNRLKLFVTGLLTMIVALTLSPVLKYKAAFVTVIVLIVGILITILTKKSAEKGFKIIPFNEDKWFSKEGNLKFYGFYDKLEHAFFYVPLVYLVVLALFNFNITPIYIRTALLDAFCIGLLKEIWDGTPIGMRAPSVLKGNGFSIKDLLADFLGILIFATFFSLFI